MADWLWALMGWSSARARARICAGRVPARMRVRGALDLARQVQVRSLPRALAATKIDLTGCIGLRSLPETLECEELILDRTNVDALPEGLRVSKRLSARECRRLSNIPALTVERLDLSGCTSLARLPHGLAAQQLDLAGCTQLAWLPASAALAARQLNLAGCTGLAGLPDAFGPLERLSVADCPNIVELPDGIRLRRWIEVAGSGLRHLPWSLRSVTVHWRGIAVSDRIAFGDPDDFTIQEIAGETNLTIRRVLLERVGLNWIVDRGRAILLDRDHDRGGERRLLLFRFNGDEDIVCVVVHCPSTGHRYVLRVPPRTRTCQEAIAWTAGFADPQLYRPVVET